MSTNGWDGRFSKGIIPNEPLVFFKVGKKVRILLFNFCELPLLVSGGGCSSGLKGITCESIELNIIHSMPAQCLMEAVRAPALASVTVGKYGKG
jgi:hypothetical protein